MWKIDLTPYETSNRDEKGNPVLYDVKDSCVEVLLNPALKLNARRALENDILARTICEAGDTVLLEKAEYDKLTNASNILEGFGREDIPFLKRIFEATEVEVKEA